MKTNIKSVAGQTAKLTLKWVVVFLPGMFLSILFFIIAFYLLYNGNAVATSTLNGTGRFATHTGASSGKFVLIIEFLKLIVTDPFPMVLWLLSVFVMPYVYFTLATKYTLSAAFSKIWDGNLGNWFSDKITSYTDKIFTSKKGKTIDSFASKKIQLVQAMKKDSELTKWQRKYAVFITKKIKLEEDDFSSPDLST